jgi:hypothetical protein
MYIVIFIIYAIESLMDIASYKAYVFTAPFETFLEFLALFPYLPGCVYKLFRRRKEVVI